MSCFRKVGMFFAMISLSITGFNRADSAPVDAASESASDSPVAEGTSASEIFETPVEPLIPKTPLTQAQRDQLEAITLFSAARMHQQRQDLSEALRLYERALRHDPKALPVLEQIVTLAFELERTSEAIRYALMAAELQPSRPDLLRQLGLHLFGKDDVSGAVRLYEKALSLPQVQASASGRIQLLAEIGQMYSDLNQSTKAVDAYAEVQEYIEMPAEDATAKRFHDTLLKRFGGAGVAYEQFAEAYLKADRFDEAVDAFEKANIVKPNRSRLAYNLARVQFRRGDTDRSLATLQTYFDEQGSDLGQAPYRLLAELLAKGQRTDDLIVQLETLHNNDPENGSLTLFLAQQEVEAHQFDRSSELYEELIETSHSIEARRGLIQIDRQRHDAGALLNHLGLGAGGDQSAQQLPADPRDWLGDEGDALIKDAKLLNALLERVAEPVADKELARRRNLTLSWLVLAAGQTDKAEKLFEAGVDETDEQAVGLLRAWGLELLSGEKYEAASRWLRRAIDVAGTDENRPPFEHYYLAGALEMAGQTDEALRVAREGARRAEPFPEWVPMFRSRVAWVAYHARQYDLAEELYRALIDEFNDEPGSGDVRDVLRNARLVLSNLESIRGNLTPAKEWLEQVLDEFPEDISALNDLGFLWADEGIKLERALKMIRKAIEAEPDNAAYRDSLGWVLYKLERYEESLVEMRKAAETGDPDGVIFDHLGDVYLKLDRLDEARDAWRRALELFDPEYNSDFIEKTRQKLATHASSADEANP